MLFAPDTARVARLRRILVPHEGTPDVAPGLESAARIARPIGAEVVVLHVPAMERPEDLSSLPAPRFADRPYHEWREWRAEFERRFLGCLGGTRWSLEVGRGAPPDAVVGAARSLPADLIIATWKASGDRDRASTLRGTLLHAPCPVLVLAERPGGQPGEAPPGRAD